MTVINFTKYKEKKERLETRNVEVKKAYDKVRKEHANKIKVELIDLAEITLVINSLQERHEFDMNFLELIDLFMQEQYPDFSWKFDLWLDEIEKLK